MSAAEIVVRLLERSALSTDNPVVKSQPINRFSEFPRET